MDIVHTERNVQSMYKINRGKDFEAKIKEAFEKVPNCSIDRIHDQVSGYAGSCNIADFIIYKKPRMLYLECKCCYGNTLPFSNITNNQWKGLLEKSEINGVIAGVVIWFIDLDKTIFISIQTLQQMKKDGLKSVNAKTFDPMEYEAIQISGEKKRIFFDYDMEKFLHDIGD